MPQTIEAVYEHGILKPLESLKLHEHQLVKITVTPTTESKKAVPPAVKRIINHLSGPLPTRTSKEIIQDTRRIDAD